jgi:hypothetical protein
MFREAGLRGPTGSHENMFEISRRAIPPAANLYMRQRNPVPQELQTQERCFVTQARGSMCWSICSPAYGTRRRVLFYRSDLTCLANSSKSECHLTFADA